jgi:hypothetical protein
MSTRSWIGAGLPDGAYDSLANGLPASRLWSLLLDVARARAARRRLPDVVGQWQRDRFVQPSIVDQRALVEIDRHLLAAAADFDAIELSPVAPLGVCSLMGRASQNKVLSALRGTEVVADPTNVMALECARRLKKDASAAVRLATSHRCVRAQPLPPNPAFTASFRIFCLASAGVERKDHACVVSAVAGQITTLLGGLDRLEQNGYAFTNRRVTILATGDRAPIADRIAALITGAPVDRAPLEHPYYSGGLRFQINAGATGAGEFPLGDGGAFDWVAALTSNRRAVFVASGFGSQLAALLFRTTASR